MDNILIQIMMDNGHIYCVHIIEDENVRVLSATRFDKEENAEICMEMAEEYSLEDNLIALRENLELWEMMKELADKEEQEREKKNRKRTPKLS